MQRKFAKLLANNIGEIAENTTRIVLIDARIGLSGTEDHCCARVSCLNAIEKAKARIADILVQPGSQPNAMD